MQDTSKVIIGATLVMVVTLAFVIAFILVLLAELYCSLLLRRKNTNTNSSPSHSHSPSTSPQNFSNIYSQGVLQAPRNFLFPTMENIYKEKQIKLHQIINIQTQESLSMSPFTSRAPPPQHTNTPHQNNFGEISCLGDNDDNEKNHLVYISNPIYENEEGKKSGVNSNTPPFETPNSSPSHLAKSDSSSDDDSVVVAKVEVEVSTCYTTSLTPMKKLSTEACSVCVRDVRSLGTIGSDSIISHSVNGLSSSSSGSPSTSSW